MLNKKSLSPLIATILLIVVSVILVIIVLTWGKNVFLTSSLSATDTIFTEADSYLYMFSFQKLQNNNLIFKNISSSNKDIIIVGYKINSFYDHKLLNKINYLQEPTTLSPGSLANIKIVVPPEESFSVEFYTDDNKYITLSNIRETNPVHNFFAVFGGDLTNALGQNNLIIQTSDGGYLLLGVTNSYGAGSDDIWLIKTDSSGNTCDYSSNGNCTGTGTFAKTFGGASSESPTQILESSDGGYLLLGRTTSYGAGSNAIWFIKTDSQGNTCDYSSNGNCTGTGTFAKTFGGASSDSPTQILESSDGGYLLLGYTPSYGAGSWDIWLIKTDSSGNTCDYSSNGNCTGTGTFAKTFGGSSSDSPTQILESSDGGYFIFGRNEEIYGEFDWGNLYMIKTNSVGEIILEKTIGGKMVDYFYSFYQTTDGGAIVGGLTASYGGVHEDWSCNIKILILKIDKNGNINIDNLPESTFIGEEFGCEY